MPPDLQTAWNLENCRRICWRSMLFDRVTIRVRHPPLSVPGSTLENNTVASQQFSCDTFRTLINFEIAYSSRTGQSRLLWKYLISPRVSTRYCWNSGEIHTIFADNCRSSSQSVGELTFNPRVFQLDTLKIHEDSVASASLSLQTCWTKKFTKVQILQVKWNLWILEVSRMKPPLANSNTKY